MALIVGTALNFINQGDAVFGVAPINWLKLVLTFVMPYAVSTYGAVAVRWDAGVREKPANDISN
ncbi:MAG: nitrate/nitrite transporter NrtS [Novosphingobium sp.]